MPLLKWSSRRNASLTPAELALSAAGGAYVVITLEGMQEHCSENLAELFGISASSSSLSHVMQALDDSAAEMFRSLIIACHSGTEPDELYLQTDDGKKIILCQPHINKPSPDLPATHIVLWFFDRTEEQLALSRQQNELHILKSDIKLYSTILNCLPCPVWQRDAQLDIKYYNLAYSSLIDEELEMPGPDSLEIDRKARVLAKLARDKNQPKAERRAVIVDGSRRLYDLHEIPLSSEGLNIGMGVDVSEFETLREELQRYISAQSDLLESSASAMAIYGADMRLQSYNYAFVKLWGLEEHWLDTKPSYGEVLEGLREVRKLPEQANFQAFKQQQIKLFTSLIDPQEEFFYLPDGRALRVIAIPHALGGILFAYEDVTDRLALERSYNTLIAVQRESLDHLHEGVALFGEDGRLKLSNPVYLKMWGFDAQLGMAQPHISDLVERTREFYEGENWEEYRADRIAQIQSRTRVLQRIERKDGKVIDCAIVPLPDGATLVTYLDVTDSTLVERSLMEKNEALEEADRLKSQFLANVSYELRSPLTSITGFSEMLKQEYFGALSVKQREYVEGIHQASNHLMRLVNDILDLASIEAGYMRLEVQEFDIHEMLQSLLTLLGEHMKQQNLELNFECTPEIGTLYADQTRIKQILFNLMSNAIRYSDAGGSISLGASTLNEDEIMIWVEDRGQGIPKAEHEAIFQNFYKGKMRDKKSRSGARAGTGLGLSIVKSFVELHGGRIDLTSSPQKGTRITCILKRRNPALQSYERKKMKGKTS